MADEKMLTYNALDAACTMEIHDAFWQSLIDEGYGPTYEMTIKTFDPLLFMMTRGIKVDKVALEDTKRDITAAIKEASEELNRLAGRELNPLSPKQVQGYFYIEKGIKPYTGKDGNITTDDKALQRIARGTSTRAGLREASLIQQIRGLNKLYSSYLDINFDTDDRLRCAYNPRGTKFGRLSSSETVFGTGTNQQNLPQEFKKFLVADDGYFFLEVDKRQAEWVVVAYLSGDANMIEVLRAGDDPHVHTAHLMFGIPKDIIGKENKLVGPLTDPEEIADRRAADPDIAPYLHVLPRIFSARQGGKESNHALNYDEQYRRFALENEIEERESKRMVEAYHRIYPGIRGSFHEGVRHQLSKDRTLTTCFGRKIRFLDAWGPDLFKAAYSAIPQATVVDGLNQGMARTYSDTGLTQTLNIDILAQVHDSVLHQFPIAILKRPADFARAIARIYDYVSPEMEYHGRKFKIATDTKVGWNWGGHHKERNPRGMVEIKPWKSTADLMQQVTKALGATNVKGSK